MAPRPLKVPRWRGTAGPVLALLAAAGCAGSSQGGSLPSNVRAVGSGASEPGQGLTVEALGGFLGAGYLYSREHDSGSSLKKEEHQAQERAGVGAAGSVLSSSFMTYELTGVVGPSQAWSDDGTDSTFDTGTLYEAEANAHLFARRWHPGNLYFSRIQDFQPRLFLSRLETTTTTGRATQDFLGSDGSARLEAAYRRLEQTVFGAEETPFLDVTEKTLGASGDYRISRYQQASGSYSYQDVDQQVTRNSFTAHNLLGTHILNFDDANAHQLRSRAEGILQDGSLDQKLLRLDETLTSRLTDTLDAEALFHFEENQTNLLDLEILRGEGGFRHQLYESLTSTVRAFGGRQTADEQSTTDNFGGILSFLYRKKTPVGTLRMSYSNFLERRWVDNSSGGVVDERLQFPAAPPEEIQLLQSGIDAGSIVITDVTGLLFYVEGADYTIRQDARGITFIVRTLTSNIPIGGEVLVDYTFQIGSDYTLDTMTQRFRLEHEFLHGITPYFAFYHQDQKFRDLQGPDLTPVRERSLIGGLEWRRPSFLLGGEYETRESTILPFDAVRLRAEASTALTATQSLILNVTQAWLWYEDPERDVSALQGTLRWRADLPSRLSMYLDSLVRYEDDSIQGTSLGFGFSGGLEYRWRLFTIRLRASHRQTETSSSRFEGDEIGLWLVREFGRPPPTTSAAAQRFLRQ